MTPNRFCEYLLVRRLNARETGAFARRREGDSMNAVYANSCPRPVFSQQRASSQAVLHILRLEFKQQEQRTVIRNPRLTTLPVSSPPRPMPHYMQLPPCLLCTGGLKISGLVPNCQPTAAAVKHQGRTAGRSSSNFIFLEVFWSKA